MRWIDILVFFWVGKQLKWYEMMFAMWNDVCDVNFKALLHSKNLVSWFVSGMKSLPYHTRHEMNQFRVIESHQNWPIFLCFDAIIVLMTQKMAVSARMSKRKLRRRCGACSCWFDCGDPTFFSLGGTPPTKKFLHSRSRVWEFWRNYPLEDTVDSQPSIFFGGRARAGRGH